MLVILPFILGLVPGVFWLWYVYRRDKYQYEPIALVLLVTGLGALSIGPAVILEEVFHRFIYPLDCISVHGCFIAYFFGVGPIEELCKFLAVLAIYWHKAFDEPVDGIIYGSASAVGFATVENLLYITSGPDITTIFSVFIARFLLATVAHIFFACMWGYNLGKRRMGIKSSVVVGLITAMFLHGLYNFILSYSILSSSLLLPLMVVMFLMARGRLRHALILSPFRFKKDRLVRCPYCKEFSKFRNGFCIVCGRRYEVKGDLEARCPSCGRLLDMFKDVCSNPNCRQPLRKIVGLEEGVEENLLTKPAEGDANTGDCGDEQ